MQYLTLRPEQVKQIQCLKNKDANIISTSAENTGAFIHITPAVTVRSQVFLQLSTLFISIHFIFLFFIFSTISNYKI